MVVTRMCIKNKTKTKLSCQQIGPYPLSFGHSVGQCIIKGWHKWDAYKSVSNFGISCGGCLGVSRIQGH